MRKVLFCGLLLGLAALAAASGCATVTMTPEENCMLQRRVFETDMLQIGDDWNLIWLNDRPSRLTRWITR
jgi:hypothetical protein